MAQGNEPDELMAQALEQFAETLRLSGKVDLMRAQRRLDTDQNPTAALQRTRAALERSIEQNPGPPPPPSPLPVWP